MSTLELTRAAELRQRAAALLEQLVEERERLEAALCEDGRPDQFKAVTGTSSLDTVIASTRRIISELDLASSLASPTNGLDRDRDRDRGRRAAFVKPRAAVPAAIGI